MVIYTQDYRKWEGTYRKRPYKILGIIHFGIKRVWSSKWVKICLILGWIPTIFFIVLSILFSPFITALFSEGMNQFYFNFASLQIIWTILLTATAGSSLISEDIENKSITLYYSSSIEKIDYFLGKFGIIGSFISLVTVLPSTILYWVLNLVSSTPIKGNLWIWEASVLDSIIIIVFLSMLIIFLSSLTKNSKYAGASFFGLIFGSSVIAGILYEVTNNKWMILISIFDNLDIIKEKIFKITIERPIEWYYSFSLILGITILFGVFSYLRLRRLELSE